MIKDCKVILNNDVVTVFKYGDVEVQIPAIKREASTVKVEYKNGCYAVVPDDYKEAEWPAKKEKKTTIKSAEEAFSFIDEEQPLY